MTEQEIDDICEELFIKEYTINTDGSIDVDNNKKYLIRKHKLNLINNIIKK